MSGDTLTIGEGPPIPCSDITFTIDAVREISQADQAAIAKAVAKACEPQLFTANTFRSYYPAIAVGGSVSFDFVAVADGTSRGTIATSFDADTQRTRTYQNWVAAADAVQEPAELETATRLSTQRTRTYQNWVAAADAVQEPAELETATRLSRQLMEEYEQKIRAQTIAAAVAAREAKTRARALLDDNLSAEQRASLRERNHFTVASRDGQRKYIINRGRAGNVLQMVAGKAVKKLCIHPEMECPDEDTMLAQKLLLETDEAEFLRIANHVDLATDVMGGRVAPEYPALTMAMAG